MGPKPLNGRFPSKGFDRPTRSDVAAGDVLDQSQSTMCLLATLGGRPLVYSPENNTAHVGVPGKLTLPQDTNYNVAAMHSGQMARKSDSPARNPMVVNMGPMLDEAVDKAEAPKVSEWGESNLVKSLR